MEQYITRLRLLAKDMNLVGQEMIRDRLAFGTNSAKVRERRINERAQLTLEKAIQIALNFEYSQQQLKTMGPPGTDNYTIPKDVNAVTRGRPHSRGRGRGNIRSHRSTVPSRRRGTCQRGRDDHRGLDNAHTHQDKCQNWFRPSQSCPISRKRKKVYQMPKMESFLKRAKVFVKSMNIVVEMNMVIRVNHLKMLM